MRKKSFDIPIENTGGNCFVAAVEAVMEIGEGALLVHGIVSGQGALTGIEYPHAWCECDGIVIDDTVSIVMPVSQYYHIGNIEEVVKYNYQDMLKNLVTYGHYGPWEDFLNFEYREL